MIARISKALNEKDKEQGFTLIELLVVVIIIGILAAIAIPVFLNQRKSAVDASMKSDLRTVATSMETYLTSNNAYPTTAAQIGSVAISSGNTLAVDVNSTGDGYVIYATRTAGAQPSSLAAGNAWVYDSAAGGIQKDSRTAAAGDFSLTTAAAPAATP